MAESQWLSRIEHAMGTFAARVHRRPLPFLLLALSLTGVGGFFAQRMPLVADLEKLLPNSFQSVRDLEPVRQRFGGIGYIVVVGMGGDPASLKQFAEDYVPQLQQLPGIRYVDYKKEGKFFIEREPYFLELGDLETIVGRLKEREKYERRQMNPMFVKLDDEAPPSLDFSDIEAKYGRRSDQRLAGAGEDYYIDPQKKMIVLLAKPEKTASDLAFSDKLVTDVENFFAKQDLSRYGKDFKVGLTGTFKYKADQQRQLDGDMKRASLAALIVLLVYLAFHFRSLFAVGLVLAPVFAGLAWTYGITALLFGQLNVLTGFLGAVLGGLGMEHGIHLLSRYEVLRSRGESSEEATRDAFSHTGMSAVASSTVAALTFLAIAFSEFRAFREFGAIAAIGMMVVVLSYFLVLPAVLSLISRLGWKPSSVVSGAGSEIAKLLPRYYRPVVLVLGLVLVAFIARVPGVWFNYDFHSLEDSSLPSFELDKETNRILGYSQEPVVILTDKTESERAIVKAVKERMKKEGAHSTVDFVAALDDLVPAQQAEKRQLLDRLGEIVAKVNPEKLDAETRPGFERLQRWAKAQQFVRGDIPEGIRRQFEGISGSKGGFVLIFPNIKLSDGQAVRRFAREVRGLVLPNGEQFSAAGEAMILADILEMVIRESPPILIGAIIAVLLAMWLMLGSIRNALTCFLPTAVSLIAMVGLMAVLGHPFNYLNILVVPVFVGTTVDAGIHLVSRLSEAGSDFSSVYGETGRAIVGGLITSQVGFGAMFLADHPGLNSLGLLADYGFSLNLIVMLLWFPAVLLWLQRLRRAPQASAAPSLEGSAK